MFSPLLHCFDSYLLPLDFSFLIGLDFLAKFLADKFLLFTRLLDLSLFCKLPILLPVKLAL